MAILSGIFLGLSTLIFIGPVLFYLLKSSFESGLKAGLAVALGIIIGDIICVILAIYGAQGFFENPTNQVWIALIGGILLLFIGIKYVVKPKLSTAVDVKYSTKKIGSYFINGFLINFVNPFVFLVWFGYTTYLRSMYQNEFQVVLALIFALAVIFSTDILKAFFAQRLMNLIKPSKLKLIFRIFGIIMMVFGIRLIIVMFI